MKTVCSGFGCCIVEGRIEVAGRWTVDEHLSSSVESFEPPIATNIGHWTSLTNLASDVDWCLLVTSAAGLVLKDRNCNGVQLGRRKVQVASSEWDPWTWELRTKLISFRWCYGVVSLSETAALQR